MEFPTFINCDSPLGGIFHLYSNFNRKLYKQTGETLIRHRVRSRLVLFAYVQEKVVRHIWVKAA